MEKRNIPIMDIHTAAFLDMRGHPPCLTKQGTRVVFDFPNSQSVLKIINLYNENPEVPLLDYVSHLRKLRAQMFAAR